MKYYETSKFPRAIGSAGFYSVIAVCLIAIGAITWFAVSRYNKAQQVPDDKPTPQITESNTQNGADTQNGTDIQTPQNNTQSAVPQSSPQPPAESVEAEASAPEVPYSEQSAPTSFSMPTNGKVIKSYSDKALQYSETYGDMRLHTGIDIEGKLSEEIKAMASGTVTETLEEPLLGKCVIIDHKNGITVKYCGFDTLAVSKGESVSAGRVLGTLGTVPSECADEIHIHIEVQKDSKTVSPLDILKME